MAMTSIMDAFIEHAPEVLSFFAAPVNDLFTRQPLQRDWDPALRDAISRYQTELGLARSLNGNEPVVVTGQQPALFTGPLYTIYKAITAIRLAAKLEAIHAVPVLPIFWSGSDDHDFGEAKTAHFLTKEHRPLSLVYEPGQSTDGLPLYRVPLEAPLHALIDRAANETPGSECREDIRKFLHDSLEASTSFADWNARIMARLFQDTPLVLFEPHLPAARACAASVMQQEISQPLESTRLINEVGDQLRKLGFDPQLVKGENECNFFLEMGGRRRKVVYQAGQFVLPEEQMACSAQTLLEWLDSTPERFSPNVVLRCIVQQVLFPAAAYVAGPGEFAYWAQLKPVFRHFDRPMPILYPRASAVLTSAKVKKLMGRYGFHVDDLLRGPESLLERALQAELRSPAIELLRERRSGVLAAITALAEELGDVPRGANFAREQGHSFLRRVQAEWDRMESVFRHEDVTQVKAVERQVARLCDTLAPGRKPQERVFSVFSFLFEHGWELIPRLMDTLDIESFRLNEVEL